jgi:hypothetical protein
MTVRAPMTSDPNEWVRVEPPSTARPGVLDAARWRLLNKLLSMTADLSHDEAMLALFCKGHRIPRQTVESALATYRHLSPDSWQ